MKKVVLFLLLFLSIVGVVSQGVVHKINWKIGYVAAYGVGIMLGLVALTLFGYGINRLLKEDEPMYNYSSNKMLTVLS